MTESDIQKDVPKQIESQKGDNTLQRSYFGPSLRVKFLRGLDQGETRKYLQRLFTFSNWQCNPNM